jgi:hypothetical protein
MLQAGPPEEVRVFFPEADSTEQPQYTHRITALRVDRAQSRHSGTAQ